MGFFDQSNTRLETVWFSVLAVISTLCFPFGVRLGRRFPQILSAKLVPVICLFLAYENVLLALSNVLQDSSPLVHVGRTTRGVVRVTGIPPAGAAVIPLFLVVMFEVAYAVHKRRSVKFCGIVFDQGHRRSVEPCSWFLRNFVRIVAVMIFVVGILVNYNVVGNDEKAGGTGLYEVDDASAHLLLALLPTTAMALIALYIAIYMWKYGNDASIVVQSTICNGWIFLFLGTSALLAGQVPPEWCFRVANASGQVLLLLSLIAVGREIGKEVQAANDFSSFLEKANELEVGSESGSHPMVTPAFARPERPNPAVTAHSAAEATILSEEGIIETPDADAHVNTSRSGSGNGGEGERGARQTTDDVNNIHDVTRPMNEQGGGRSLSRVFNMKQPPSFANSTPDGDFPELSQNAIGGAVESLSPEAEGAVGTFSMEDGRGGDVGGRQAISSASDRAMDPLKIEGESGSPKMDSLRIPRKRVDIV